MITNILGCGKLSVATFALWKPCGKKKMRLIDVFFFFFFLDGRRKITVLFE